jgi:hypothetical protein
MQFRSVNWNSPKIQYIDSLPITNIKSEIELTDSITFSETNSNFFINAQDFFYLIKNLKMSETLKNNPQQDIFYKIRKLSHIELREIKFGVDDYGIINYLNQDF